MRSGSLSAVLHRGLLSALVDGIPSQPSAAAAPAFLANEDASYVSGAAIVVDGALTAVTRHSNFDRLIGGE
jgi:NAD(P)-dependent dehydrogenase (short-subunit alcohol dehydrogenase family)